MTMIFDFEPWQLDIDIDLTKQLYRTFPIDNPIGAAFSGGPFSFSAALLALVKDPEFEGL